MSVRTEPMDDLMTVSMSSIAKEVSVSIVSSVDAIEMQEARDRQCQGNFKV